MKFSTVQSACAGAALACGLLSGCDKKPSALAESEAPGVLAAPAPVTDESLMTKGVGQMNGGNPIGAVATFREMLARNPAHYGAHFQLAKAFDRAGQPDSARTWWTKVAAMAQAANDTQSAGTARARLARPDTVSQEAMMVVGLDLANAQKNPGAAADQFRKVLSRNPTHYGATYQLAQALDKSGKPADAHKVWINVLSMAEAVKDQASIDVARARLKQNP